MSDATYLISGMTCDHCVAAVTQELTAVPGIQGVTIELVPGGQSTATVTSAEPLSIDVVRQAVDEAGYELIG